MSFRERPSSQRTASSSLSRRPSLLAMMYIVLERVTMIYRGPSKATICRSFFDLIMYVRPRMVIQSSGCWATLSSSLRSQFARTSSTADSLARTSLRNLVRRWRHDDDGDEVGEDPHGSGILSCVSRAMSWVLASASCKSRCVSVSGALESGDALGDLLKLSTYRKWSLSFSKKNNNYFKHTKNGCR